LQIKPFFDNKRVIDAVPGFAFDWVRPENDK
jgi:hypothetical protein